MDDIKQCSGRQFSIQDRPDPYEPGKTLKVRVNTAESPTEMMFARGDIDLAQYQASNRFRRAYERAARIGSISQDPAREPVDSGQNGGGITDMSWGATQELSRVHAHLLLEFGLESGAQMFSVLHLVSGEGHWIKDAAPRALKVRSKGKRRELRAGKLFKDALDELAVMWGIADRRRR